MDAILNDTLMPEVLADPVNKAPADNLVPYAQHQQESQGPESTMFHTVCACIGLPLNMMVVRLILARRSLWELRNIVWLLATIANIVVLINDVLHFYTFDSWKNELICMIVYMIMGNMVIVFF